MGTYTIRELGVSVPIEGDTPNQDEARRILAAVRTIRSRQESEQATQQMQAQNNAELGALGRFGVGLGRGFTDVAEGVSQLARSAVGDATDYTRERQAERDVYQRATQDAGGFGAGRFAGNVLPTLVVPGGAAGGLAARAGTAAAAGAGIGAASFVPEGESRLANAAIGAAAGAGGSALFSGLGRGLRWVSGRDVDGAAGQLSREFDIPISVGEARGAEGLKRIETVLERVPLVGTSGFRAEQAAAAERAARSVVDEFGVGASNIDEAADYAVGAIRRTLTGRRTKASRMFDRVERMAGDEAVDLSGTREAVRQAASMSQRQTTREAIARAVGDPLADFTDRSFADIRRLRSEIGRQVRQLGKGVAQGADSANPEAFRALQSVADALESDLQRFADSKGGRLAEAFNRARRFYRDQVVPLKRNFGRVLDDDTSPDYIFTRWLNPNRPKRAERLIDALGGQPNVARFAVLRQAFDDAVQGRGFSPQKFANAIEKYQRINRVVFTQEQQAQLLGLQRIMSIAKRAGQYLENAPTGGNRLIDAGLGGAAVGGALAAPVATAAGAGGIKALSLLLTSKTGQRLLAKAATVQPGTRAAGELMERVMQEARRLAERTTVVAAVENN